MVLGHIFPPLSKISITVYITGDIYHFSLVTTTTTFVTDYGGWPRLDHQKLSDCIKIISE